MRLPERLYAFADAVAGPDEEHPRRRLALLFDAVDADLFDLRGSELFDQLASPKLLDESTGFVRILTTEKRLQRMEVEVPKETSWFEIELAQTANFPRAWFARTDIQAVPGRALNMRRIRPLAAGSTALQNLEAACTAPNAKIVKAATFLQRLELADKGNLKITALDVGQASCTVFSDKKGDVGYFDVGRPLPFNRRSFPKGFIRAYPKKGFVILSHWDFDHYALGRDHAELRNLDWYAPYQPVSPKTAAFQRSLGSRLHFVEGDGSLGGISLVRGLGADPNDRNANGYVMRYERGDEAVLLTGDCDYQHIRPAIRSSATALTTPHHCGKGTQPPKPAACKFLPRAVASYGKPNNYHHPDKSQLKNHADAKWDVKHTAKDGKDARSDRLLYPLGSPVSGAKAVVKTKKLASVSS